jgi:hypothetical protein
MGVDAANIKRRGNPNLPRYTEAEIETLRRVWPQGSVEEIKRALPNRSMANLRVKAKMLGVTCETYRGGGLRFGRAREAGVPIKRADEYKPVTREKIAAVRARRAEDALVGVVVTAEELRGLPWGHPGRLAFTIAAYTSGPAAQRAWLSWKLAQA